MQHCVARGDGEVTSNDVCDELTLVEASEEACCGEVVGRVGHFHGDRAVPLGVLQEVYFDEERLEVCCLGEALELLSVLFGDEQHVDLDARDVGREVDVLDVPVVGVRDEERGGLVDLRVVDEVGERTAAHAVDQVGGRRGRLGVAVGRAAVCRRGFSQPDHEVFESRLLPPHQYSGLN